MIAPSTNGDNGRSGHGRFAPGNPGGPGNPYARRVARLRAALLRTVGPADIDAIAQGLIKAAKDGDVAAARLLLSYCIGEPVGLDLLARIEALETQTGVAIP